jgi:outer membrane cobalamin receptor
MSALSWGSAQPSGGVRPPGARPRKRLALLFTLGLVLPAAAGAQAPVDESVLVETHAEPLAADAPEQTSSSVTIIELDPAADGLRPLSELLSRSAGVQVRRYGGLGSFATLSIRGSSPSQVRVYLDGIPLPEAANGTVDIDSLPVAGLQRVEVYRGTAPGRFASAGIGGVVNLVTRRAGRGPRWHLSAEAGEHGTLGARASSRLQRGALGGQLGVHALRSEGDFCFLDDNGTPLNPADDSRRRRRNSGVEQLDATARFELAAERRLTLGLTADLFAREQGIPGPGSKQAEQAHLSSRRALLGLGVRMGGFVLEGGTLELDVYGRLQREHYRDPLGEVGVGVQDQIGRYADVGLRLQAALPLREGVHRVSALAEVLLEGYRGEDLLGRRRMPHNERRSLHLVLEDPVLLAGGRWELTPRLRLQRWDSDFQPPELSAEPLPEPGLTALSPSLGVRRLLGGFVLKANAGRAVRVPGFTELFGDHGTVAGNAALRPERAWNLDVGLLRTAPAWEGALVRFETTVFASFVEDLVVYLQNSQRTFRPFNVGAARTLGVEASAAGRLGPLELALAYTLQAARDRSEAPFLRGNELPGRPPHQLAADVVWDAKALRLSSSIELLSANYLDRANLQRVGARLYHGMGVRFGGEGGWPELELRVRNLWDEQTADVGGFPLPGRTFSLSVRWQAGGR